MGKLTVLGVKAAKLPGRYQDGDGLMLLVKPTGARSWLLRVQVDGKRRDFGLGSAGQVTLSEARDKADELRKLYKSGVDPVEAKRAAKAAKIVVPTFRAAAKVAHEEHKGGWRNEKHKAQWLSSLAKPSSPISFTTTRGAKKMDKRTDNPKQLEPARLAQAPRCLARTRSGTACRSPAVNGSQRCRMHGGKGSGAPRGNRNAWKHGARSGETENARSLMRELARMLDGGES